MTSQIIVSIVDHKIANPKVVRAAFDSLEDGRYMVKIEAFSKRSLAVNAYYWGVCVPMVKDGLKAMGFNEVRNNNDAHIVMKHLFLKRTITSEISGESIIVEVSTTELNKEAFNQFISDIWQWASTYLNIQIPQPNEQLTII
jgi:hypothetical protein